MMMVLFMVMVVAMLMVVMVAGFVGMIVSVSLADAVHLAMAGFSAAITHGNSFRLEKTLLSLSLTCRIVKVAYATLGGEPSFSDGCLGIISLAQLTPEGVAYATLGGGR